MTGKDKDILKCWEYFNCGKNKCPSYNSDDLRCWLNSGNFCREDTGEIWLEKIEACIHCEVFNNNITDEDWKETLKLISRQFRDYKRQIREEEKIIKETKNKLQEFKTTSIYLLRELDKKSKEVIAEKNGLEKRVEEKTKELVDIQTKLMQSTKMASIGRFSAGIAHEINNPLGAIINYIRTILANPAIDGQNKGYLELTLKGLFRIENIVKQVLGYTGQHRQQIKPTNIKRLINDMVVFMQHRLSENKLELDLNIDGSIPNVLVDPMQMQQVFSNIINNAIDAVENGGKLTIEALSDDRDVKIRFIDNGKGIDEKDLDKIFEPFYTTKSVGKGTGLGLFISYNIIQMYRGTIDIKSQQGKGTTVTISLPYN